MSDVKHLLLQELNFLGILVIGDRKLYRFSQVCTNLFEQNFKNVLANARAKAGAFVCGAPAE